MHLSKAKNGKCFIFLFLCMLIDILFSNFDKLHFISLFIDILAIFIVSLFSYYGILVIVIWSFFTDISTSMPLGSNAIFYIMLVFFCYKFRELMISNNAIRSKSVMACYLIATILCLLYRYCVALLCVSAIKIDINFIDIIINYTIFFFIIRYFQKKDIEFPDRFIFIK